MKFSKWLESNKTEGFDSNYAFYDKMLKDNNWAKKAGVLQASEFLLDQILIHSLNVDSKDLRKEIIDARKQIESILKSMRNVIKDNERVKREWSSDQVKKPLNVEKIKCPDCGHDAVYYDYGIGAGGNQDERIECENPRCSSHYSASGQSALNNL